MALIRQSMPDSGLGFETRAGCSPAREVVPGGERARESAREREGGREGGEERGSERERQTDRQTERDSEKERVRACQMHGRTHFRAKREQLNREGTT